MRADLPAGKQVFLLPRQIHNARTATLTDTIVV
jgi:hypothetical protein